jgi:hypothetical protein
MLTVGTGGIPVGVSMTTGDEESEEHPDAMVTVKL